MEINFKNLDSSSPFPLYRQISAIIKEKIVSKEITVGQRLPPEHDLSKTFNVSVLTVRASLAELVNEGLLVRKQNRGTFVISSGPEKTVDLTKKNEIGVVVNPYREDQNNYFDPNSHPYFHKILTGIEEKLREHNLFMIYTSSGYGSPFSLNGKEKDIAGLILISTGISLEFLGDIKKTGLPLILIGDVTEEKITDEGIDVITSDDFKCLYMVTKHIIGMGHRRIAYITDTTKKYSWEIRNLEGYVHALNESGIAYDESLVIEAGSREPDAGYGAMNKFLDKSVDFTALIGTSHGRLCSGAMRAIKERGLRIPEDIYVVSDDTPVSIEYRLDEMGRIAVKRLLERIRNPGLEPSRITVPGRLVVKTNEPVR